MNTETKIAPPDTQHNPVGIAIFGFIFSTLGSLMVLGGHPIGALIGVAVVPIGGLFFLTATIRGALFGWSSPKNKRM